LINKPLNNDPHSKRDTNNFILGDIMKTFLTTSFTLLLSINAFANSSLHGEYSLKSGSHFCKKKLDSLSIMITNDQLTVLFGGVFSVTNLDLKDLDGRDVVVNDAFSIGVINATLTNQKINYVEKGKISLSEDGTKFIPYSIKYEIQKATNSDVQVEFQSMNAIKLGGHSGSCVYSKK
jgi:hypothetical protein